MIVLLFICTIRGGSAGLAHVECHRDAVSEGVPGQIYSAGLTHTAFEVNNAVNVVLKLIMNYKNFRHLISN